MSTQLATLTRRGLILGDRAYPLLARAPQEKPKLSPLFDRIRADLRNRLPVLKGDVPKLFEAYAKGGVELSYASDGYHYLRTLVSKLGGFQPMSKPFEVRLPAYGIELAAQGESAVKEALRSAFDSAAEGLVFDMQAQLDLMVERKHVGLLVLAGNMARYVSYERKTHTQETGRSSTSERTVDGDYETTTSRTQRDFTKTVTMSVIMEDLVNVDVSDAVADSECQTSRAVKLIEEGKTYLGPHLRIVSGDQVRELKGEWEVSRESWSDVDVEKRFVPKPVYQFDPALVLGHYVLTAWTPASVFSEKKQAWDAQEASRVESVRRQMAKLDYTLGDLCRCSGCGNQSRIEALKRQLQTLQQQLEPRAYQGPQAFGRKTKGFWASLFGS